METNGVNYTRHIYNRTTGTGLNAEYELIKNSLQRPIMPDVVRIEAVNGLNNNQGIKEWLCIYNCPSWVYGNRVTGLRKLNFKNIFEGSLINPTSKEPTPGSLIFFEFSKNREILVIDVFKDFYTDNPFAFQLIVEGHQFLLSKKGSR